MEKERMAILLALSAGILLVICAFIPAWWTVDRSGIGLLSVRECADSGASGDSSCSRVSLSVVVNRIENSIDRSQPTRDPDRMESERQLTALSRMMWAGRASWALAIAAALGLVVVAVLLYTKVLSVRPRSIWQLGALAAVAPFPIYLFRVDELTSQASAGWPPFGHFLAVFLVGVAATLISAKRDNAATSSGGPAA
jgi:hypothetical protein